MKLDKKGQKNRRQRDAGSERPKFELEEDADSLMEQYLEKFKPLDKDADLYSNQHSDREGKLNRKSSRKKNLIFKEIDLHGLTVEEAKSKIRAKFNEWIHDFISLEIKVITGKGRHSPEGVGVLAGEIHDFIRREFSQSIYKIEESPRDVMIGGMPFRGHFHVIFQKKRQ